MAGKDEKDLENIEKLISYGMFDNYEKKILDQKNLLNISEMINSKLNMEEMNEALLFISLGTIHVSKIAIFLFDNIINNTYIMKSSVGLENENLELHITEKDQIIKKLSKEQKPILINEIEKLKKYQATLKLLKPLEPTIIIPMKYKNKVTGFMTFDKKFNSEAFTNSEIDFLCSVANLAAIAAENIRLFEMATKDRMTDLYVHHYFQNRLEEEIARAIRYKKSLTLLMFDIDFFKSVNDTYGHQAGDIIIKKTANIIKTDLRKIDFPARYGGEEFAVILPESNENESLLVAERIRKKIEDANFKISEKKNLKITISGGICELESLNIKNLSRINNKNKLKERLIKGADLALYKAKHQGRNQITIYSPLSK